MGRSREGRPIAGGASEIALLIGALVVLASCAKGHMPEWSTDRRTDGGRTDGGPRDAGSPDRDAGRGDAGGPECALGERCDDGVFCNGLDSCDATGACTVHEGDPCGGDTVCDESADSCVGCASDADCPAPSCGPWSGCTYAAPCSTGGSRTRTCTDYRCESGTCEGDARTESDGTACERTVECSEGAAESCTTGCGSTGTRTCGSSCTWGSCTPPGETCNLADDDCDGDCDDGAGCRVAIHRAYNASSGDHFYTRDLSETSCCGYSLEYDSYFRLYSAAAAGLAALYRCWRAPDHFYTTSSTCEGASGATNEGVIGYIGTSSSCDSTPLYRLYNTGTGDHFYTISASERDSAIAGGYVSEGVAGHVWTMP